MAADGRRPPMWPVLAGVFVVLLAAWAVHEMAAGDGRPAGDTEEIVPSPTTGVVVPPDEDRYLPPAVDDYRYFVQRRRDLLARQPGEAVQRLRGAINAVVVPESPGVSRELEALNRQPIPPRLDRRSPEHAREVRDFFDRMVGLMHAVNEQEGHPSPEMVAALREAAEAIDPDVPLRGQDRQLTEFFERADWAVRAAAPRGPRHRSSNQRSL
jgi:hypothetical protein